MSRGIALNSMLEDAPFSETIDAIRARLIGIASAHGATFVDSSDEERPDGAPPFLFRLVPPSSQAAAVEVMPDDPWSTYIGVGSGSIEVFMRPKNPEPGVEDVISIVEAVVAGRLRERVWRRKGNRSMVNSLLHIQLTAEDQWRVIGEISRPLPIIRRWLYDEEVIHYAPYDTG